ncbi:enoyl-CoA hydratase [Alphaproteobacteria bacterium]|nr:enoyl-CoA hydratase [Alphaproteobacteria bacterium]
MEIKAAVEHDKKGALGFVIFDNQTRRNAMTLAMWRSLASTLDGFATDPAVRTVVLAGAGNHAFVSGSDISEFDRVRNTPKATDYYNATVEAAEAKLFRLAKPTVAKLKGVCVGGGVGIAVCCDIRIASETARFAVTSAKLGLGYGVNGVKRIYELVGPSAAADLLYSGRMISAQEALQIGLVTTVVHDDLIDDHVEYYAETIAANAPLSIAASKAAIQACGDRAIDHEMLEKMVNDCYASDDYTEGRQAFNKKRKPQFNGK